MKRFIRKTILTICICLIAFSVLNKKTGFTDTFLTKVWENIKTLQLPNQQNHAVTPNPDLNQLEAYQVKRVVDGDTFIIESNNKEIRVRLIGVDTPESVASKEYLERTGKENTEEGKSASDFTKSLIENQTVYLEYDVSKTDIYGRLLAYVFLEDGTMLQDILLSNNYANLATYPPNIKYVDHFTEIVENRKED